MTSLIGHALGRRYIDTAYTDATNFWGLPLPSFRPNQEGLGSDFVNLVNGAYKANSVVFACEMTRMALFSEARFQWRRRFQGSAGGDVFGTSDLEILEKPWPKGTTSDLLTRLLLDADLAGTAFVARRYERAERLMRMRPDWCVMVLGSQDEPNLANIAMDADFLGVIYYPGGIMSGQGAPVHLLAEEVTYFAPIPDPLAAYRGMSWLTPLVREVEADSAATQHKLMFFRNGATPQLVVSMGPNVTPAALKEFVAKMESAHTGTANAYKTLYLGGGADVHVVGKDLQQLDFKLTQGAGETRIAAASGVHPVVAALSEGLSGSSLNDGNFRAASRLVADRTLRPLWRNVCGSLEDIVPPPPGCELWWAERDISFLRESSKDTADIQNINATTIKTLVDAQYEPDSVVKAVTAQDWSLLKHTGIPTVQGLPGFGQNGTKNGASGPNGVGSMQSPMPAISGGPMPPNGTQK